MSLKYRVQAGVSSVHINVLWYRVGLAFEAHRLVYHSAVKAQGPSRTCNESKEEEGVDLGWVLPVPRDGAGDLRRGVVRGLGWGGAIDGPLFSKSGESLTWTPSPGETPVAGVGYTPRNACRNISAFGREGGCQ